LKGWAPRFARAPGTTDVSGVILSDHTAANIATKANALANMHRPPVTFLTLHSYLIPKVSGLSSWLPAGDLVGEALTKPDYDRILRFLTVLGAHEIYVDPIGRDVRDWYSEPYVDFYGKLLDDVRVIYRPDRVVDGWEVWVRRSRESPLVGGPACCGAEDAVTRRRRDREIVH
jgi:hypothetical protein